MSTASESWSCNISLCRNKVDLHGVTTDRKAFGETITDKGEIELWIRRAQAAILSTRDDPDEFLSMSMEELRRTVRAGTDMRPFCDDMVAVDVKDPDLTDLHFVDLPGMTTIVIVTFQIDHWLGGRINSEFRTRNYRIGQKFSGFTYKRREYLNSHCDSNDR